MAINGFPTIDAHIHLYARSHLPRLNWTADLPAEHILNQQSSVDEYRVASQRESNLLGFVFVETDRKFGLDEAGWQDPLAEVAFLVRIARGEPLRGEGHSAADSKLVLGIVPWAPIPAGSASLAKYVSQVKDICGEDQVFNLVKGYRYLLQDKPTGTMLQPEFIDGLMWLGQQALTFDLGVDSHRGGIDQLREVSQLLKEVFNRKSKLKVILNHFCKPKFVSSTSEAEDGDFQAWKEYIQEWSSYPSTYMKLSGFFSELPSQSHDTPTSLSHLLHQVKPWVDVVFTAFGPSRIMFGSDWPVCSAGGPGTKSWQHWVDLIARILDDQNLNPKEKQLVWSGTAMEAYSITLPKC